MTEKTPNCRHEDNQIDTQPRSQADPMAPEGTAPEVVDPPVTPSGFPLPGKGSRGRNG